MNLGLRYEEAVYLRDIILMDIAEYGVDKIKKVYGNIDIEGIMKQLNIIILLAESVEDEKRVREIFK